MSGGAPPDATLARGQAVLAQQPFSTLLGVHLTALSDAGAELRLPVRDALRQQYGFVHGGVLAYLADNAMTFAGAVFLGQRTVTLEMKLNYIRPAGGEELIARAAALSAGRTQSVVRCEIVAVRDGAERLCAAAQGTIALAGEPKPSA
jgi:uncharacterized protein (TIGR00369 family)